MHNTLGSSTAHLSFLCPATCYLTAITPYSTQQPLYSLSVFLPLPLCGVCAARKVAIFPLNKLTWTSAVFLSGRLQTIQTRPSTRKQHASKHVGQWKMAVSALSSPIVPKKAGHSKTFSASKGHTRRTSCRSDALALTIKATPLIFP